MGTFVNNGLIDGRSGSIAISGEKFEHRQGVIQASKVDFGSGETILAGLVVGQEGFFRGSVINRGALDFQRGVIDGLFVNGSETTKFERRLELIGDRAEIQNRGKIATATIVSDAVTGIIDGGEIFATEVYTRKHLQLGANMPALTSVTTDGGAELLVEATTPQLRRIINAGNTKIATATPELEDLQNAPTGHLQLENAGTLSKITSLDHLKGTLDVRASMPAITELNLQTGATLNLLEAANFSALGDIRTQAGATLLLGESTLFPALRSIYNFGTMTSKTRLTMEAMYNAPDANLHLFRMTRVRGKTVSAEDRALVPAMSTLPKGQISVFNEGKILIRTPVPFPVCYYGLSVNGTYVGSQNSVVRVEDYGGLVANDFINDGIFYSPKKLTVSQSVDNVAKWGRLASEEEIEYVIDIKSKSDASSTFKLPNTFEPVINGANKTLKIKSKTGLEISKPINMNVDMEVETPVFKLAENLTVKSFKAKTDTFTFEPSVVPTDKRILSARDFFDIETKDFINTSGRLQTHGSKKSKIQASGLFRNTGGGKLEKNKAETITYYTWSGSGGPVPQTRTVFRDVYHPELDKAGVITTGGILEIISEEFDNSFGIINAARLLGIRSS